MPALLRDHAPNGALYRGSTRAQLRAQLAELGLKVPSTGNKDPDPITVRESLARRVTADSTTSE